MLNFSGVKVFANSVSHKGACKTIKLSLDADGLLCSLSVTTLKPSSR